MVDTPVASHYMGLDGFTWWHGIVEDRMDPLKAGRARVRIFGWHTPSKALQPTEQLLWAHPVLPLHTPTTTVKPPREGAMVFGYFMDGEAGQFPVMLGVVGGIPDQITDPTHGFSDPRDSTALQNAPRPPQSIKYPSDGTGAQITEAPNANRYPNILNEPTTDRLARNENIDQTIIQQKRQNVLQNIPVATGSIEIGGVDLNAFIQLPTITLPSISANFNIGVEFCGIGINASASAGFNFGGIIIGFPTISLSGQISLGALNIQALLPNLVQLGQAAALAVNIAGCILGGVRIGNNLIIDGGLIVPLLAPNVNINLSAFGLKGMVFGGVSLGTLGGIPLSTTPMWNEPPTPYNAQYPYNHVQSTESGHVLEIDDTPGHERIHTYHRSGTFDEMHPDGSRVQKTVKNQTDIVLADHTTNVLGNQHVTVQQDQTNLIQGNHNENVNGNKTRLIKGNITETVMGNEQTTNMKDKINIVLQNGFTNIKGDDNVVIEGNENITILKNGNIVVKGDCVIAVAGKLTIGSTGDFEIISGGNHTVNVVGDYTINVKGAINEATPGPINISGTPVNINHS